MSDDADMDADPAAEDVESGPAVNGETAEPDDGSTGDGTADTDAERQAEGASDASTDADVETDTETGLAGEVAEVDEELAREVAELEARVDELESALDDARSKLTRKQADFQNYKKRAKKRQEQIKARATEDLVERLVPVRDNLLRALDQEEGADIRPGVESTLAELDRVLEDENVDAIEPRAGDEVDPHRHEVMLRVDSDQPEGTVVDLYQPGYEMADKVIRPAQVTVSTGGGGDASADEG